MYGEDTIKNSDEIIKEILSESPEISGIDTIESIVVPLVVGQKPLMSVFIESIDSPLVREVGFDTTDGKKDFVVEIDVLLCASPKGIVIKIDTMLPLLFNGSNKLGEEISFLLSQFGFDFSSITEVRDIFYIARPIDGNEYITWADEAFFINDEARRINMIILNAIFTSEES